MSKNSGGFAQYFYSSLMPKIYGIGASIVLVGVMFKLLYWEGASEMLIVGLSTEALIFFLSAFEPKAKDFDWSIVYPELADPTKAGARPAAISGGEDKSVSRQLDQMLESANVGPELIESLGNGLRSLSENVGNMSKISNAVMATNEYADNVKAASESISKINHSYATAAQSLESFSHAMSDMAQAGEQTQSFKNELGQLNASLSALNKVYGGMLNAMKG
jgi:gliding motility-associated protein GldL